MFYTADQEAAMPSHHVGALKFEAAGRRQRSFPCMASIHKNTFYREDPQILRISPVVQNVTRKHVVRIRSASHSNQTIPARGKCAPIRPILPALVAAGISVARASRRDFSHPPPPTPDPR